MTLRNLPQESRNKQFWAALADIDAVYRVEEHDLVLDQAEKFYFNL